MSTLHALSGFWIVAVVFVTQPLALLPPRPRRRARQPKVALVFLAALCAPATDGKG